MNLRRQIIEVGGVEGGGGTLRQHQFIGPGGEGLDHPGLAAPRRKAQAGALVVEAAIAAIGGEVGDHGVDHLHAALAGVAQRLFQPGQDRRLEVGVEAVPTAGAVLDIDQEQGRWSQGDR